MTKLFEMAVELQRYYLYHLSICLPSEEFARDLRFKEKSFKNLLHQTFEEKGFTLSFDKDFHTNDDYSENPSEIRINFRINKKRDDITTYAIILREYDYILKYSEGNVILISDNVEEIKKEIYND